MFSEDTDYCQEISREYLEDIEASCCPRQEQSHGFKHWSDSVKPFTPSLGKSVGMTKRQTDKVISGTLDKNSQCCYTSADTMKHPKTSEKKSCKDLVKSCKRLVCMATPVKRSREILIHAGSPADSQSAPEHRLYPVRAECRTIWLRRSFHKLWRNNLNKVVQVL